MFASINDSPGMLTWVMVELVTISLLVVVLAVPLVQGKVEMNGWYGIRIQKAFKSKENWYAINKYGGKALISWSVICVLFAPVAILFRNDLEILRLFFYAPAVTYGIAMIQIYTHASKFP